MVSELGLGQKNIDRLLVISISGTTQKNSDPSTSGNGSQRTAQINEMTG
jgi:hypothetical protein